ncbi:L-type lectin-domain containing receptor kinase S.4-like protein [Drosera capensis]
MSHNLKPILSLLMFLFLLISIISSTQAQTDQFIYSNGFGSKLGTTNNLTLNGSAVLIKDGRFIQLTNTTNRIMGHAFHGGRIRFKPTSSSSNASVVGSQVYSFSTAFTFATLPQFKSLGGHGFAFTIARTLGELNYALPSQYLGVFNSKNVGNFSNHVFAVEFDTVQDFEFGDINDNHVGVDLNGLVSNVSAPVAYFSDTGTWVNVSMKSGITIQAWIDYDSNSRVLNVTVSPSSVKPRVPLISYNVDLYPIFGEHMFVGFSGSTGLLSSSHFILGWSFNMSGPAQSLSIVPLPSFSSSSRKNEVLVVSLSVSSLIMLILIVAAASAYVVRKVKNRDVVEDWEHHVGPHRFSYRELKQATKGFHEKLLLGHGGFGRVYKGMLRKSNAQVAVKRISHGSRQGLREFVSEIASIGHLRHRNLVQLLGWCRRHSDLLLVYDYMPNGSLDKHLFDEPMAVLSWEQRFKIVKGVASGLYYLHEGWDKVVIHRDIKASNVLLDGELNGRLGDFGLARLHDHGSKLSTTRVVGTLGYLAPELPRTGKATTYTDVFAFGTVLLEVVCGRRPIEPKVQDEELVLVDWVWDKWRRGQVLEAVDPRLEGRFNDGEAVMLLKLGFMCSCDMPMGRPSMREVIRYLEGEVPLPDVLRPPFPQNELEGFKDYGHSFASSNVPSFDAGSVGDMMSDNGYGYLPTSPTPLLPGRGVTL